MLRALGYFGEYRDWRMVAFAGVLGVVIALTMMEIIDAHSMPAGSGSLALAAIIGVFGICLVGAAPAWRIRQELSAQNLRLDVALNQHESRPLPTWRGEPRINMTKFASGMCHPIFVSTRSDSLWRE
jgi:hypothetical protein